MTFRKLQSTALAALVGVTLLGFAHSTVLGAEEGGNGDKPNSSTKPNQKQPVPVIFDTDIGSDIDDTWALALLLKSPEVQVKLVVSDSGDTEYRAKIIAKMLEVAKRTDIPVGLGIPSSQKRKPQAAWVADYDLAQYPGKVERDGVGAIVDTIMDATEPITLICVGPVPNIQAALEREPRIAEKAKFVGMHGSIRLGYGGKPKPSAEANVRNHTKSCQKTFTAAWPMLITPLDTCGLVRLKGEKYRRVADSDDPVTRALIENYRIWSNADRTDRISASSILFDTVAVYLSFSTDLANIERLPIIVSDDGFTRIDPAGKPIDCATSWKSLPSFEDFLVERLSGKRP